MWSSFLAVFRKEFLHVRRDRGTLITAAWIPIFQLILFGFIDLTVRNLPMVVVDQDRTQYSRLLMDRLRASETFRVTKVTGDADEARADMASGRARAALIIPPDFHDRWVRRQPTQVLLLIDGSDSTASGQALASATGVASAVSADAGAPRLSVAPMLLFNPTGRTANFIIPGLVAIMLQLVALVFAAVAVVRERENGTLEQLLVTPIDPVGLILGKLAPYLVLGLIEMALVLSAMRFLFAVAIRGSVLFLFVMGAVYLAALLALGLFISTRAQTQTQAQQMAQLVFLPSVFLSGYIFPVEGLPWVLRVLGQLLPATHMVGIMRGVVLRDAGPAALWRHVLALLVFAAVMVWLSVRRFRQMSES